MLKNSNYTLAFENDDKYLMLNTFTQALVEVTEEAYNDYKLMNLNSKYKDNFSELGFWIDEKRDEYTELKYESYSEIYGDNDLYVTLKMTTDCNFRCSYCYQNHEKVYMTNDDMNLFKKFIENKIDSGIKNIHVGYFGGEPLLNLNLILDFEKFMKEKNVRFQSSMTTNGYLLTQEVIDKLKETKLNTFQITLDGTAEVHDGLRFFKDKSPTFETIVSNLIKIKESMGERVKLIIRYNLNKKNLNEFSNLIDELTKRGFTHKDITFAVNKTEDINDEKNYDIYFESTKEFAQEYIKIHKKLLDFGQVIDPHMRITVPCLINKKNYFVLSPKLKIELCTSSDCEQGYINKNGEVVYNNKTINANKCIYLENIKSECKKCKYLPMCLGGCELLKSKNNVSCIKEKYIMKDLLSDYLNKIAK